MTNSRLALAVAAALAVTAPPLVAQSGDQARDQTRENLGLPQALDLGLAVVPEVVRVPTVAAAVAPVAVALEVSSDHRPMCT